MGWTNNSPLDAQPDRVRLGIVKQSEAESTLPPASLQPPQVLREVVLTFGTQGSKTEWSPDLLPESWNPEAVFEHDYFGTCPLSP